MFGEPMKTGCVRVLAAAKMTSPSVWLLVTLVSIVPQGVSRLKLIVIAGLPFILSRVIAGAGPPLRAAAHPVVRSRPVPRLSGPERRQRRYRYCLIMVMMAASG